MKTKSNPATSVCFFRSPTQQTFSSSHGLELGQWPLLIARRAGKSTIFTDYIAVQTKLGFCTYGKRGDDH